MFRLAGAHAVCATACLATITFSFAAVAAIALLVSLAMIEPDWGAPTPYSHSQTNWHQYSPTAFHNQHYEIDSFEPLAPSHQASEPDHYPVNSGTHSGGFVYQPQVSPEQLIAIHGRVRDFSLEQRRVNVQPHFRAGYPVTGHTRQPPGGHSWQDKLQADGWGLVAAAAVVAFDIGIQAIESRTSKRPPAISESD